METHQRGRAVQISQVPQTIIGIKTTFGNLNNQLGIDHHRQHIAQSGVWDEYKLLPGKDPGEWDQ